MMPRKQAKRDTAKYVARKGRKVVKKGITDRPMDEPEAETQRESGNSKVKLTQVGRRTTRDAALERERQQPDKLTRRTKRQ